MFLRGRLGRKPGHTVKDAALGGVPTLAVKSKRGHEPLEADEAEDRLAAILAIL